MTISLIVRAKRTSAALQSGNYSPVNADFSAGKATLEEVQGAEILLAWKTVLEILWSCKAGDSALLIRAVQNIIIVQ